MAISVTCMFALSHLMFVVLWCVIISACLISCGVVVCYYLCSSHLMRCDGVLCGRAEGILHGNRIAVHNGVARNELRLYYTTHYTV